MAYPPWLKSVEFCLRLMVHWRYWCPQMLSRPGVSWIVAAQCSQHSLKIYFELRWYILHLQTEVWGRSKELSGGPGCLLLPRSGKTQGPQKFIISLVPLLPCSKGKAHNNYNAYICSWMSLWRCWYFFTFSIMVSFKDESGHPCHTVTATTNARFSSTKTVSSSYNSLLSSLTCGSGNVVQSFFLASFDNVSQM